MPGSLTSPLSFWTNKIGRCAILLRENTSLSSFVSPVLRFFCFFSALMASSWFLFSWQPSGPERLPEGVEGASDFFQPSNATVFLAAFPMSTMWSWSRLSVQTFIWHILFSTPVCRDLSLCVIHSSVKKKKKTDPGLNETSWISKAELNSQQWVLWWKCLGFFCVCFFSSVGQWKNHILRFSSF